LDPSNGNARAAVAVLSDMNISRNISLEVAKSSDLNSLSPKSVTSPLKSAISNDASSSPLSSSLFSESKVNMLTSQQEKSGVDTKAGNGVPISGAVVNDLGTLDYNMKNLKLGLDGHTSSYVKQNWQDNALQQHKYNSSLPVHGDPVQMSSQGTHLSHVPFVDNFSHAQLKLPTGDMQQFLQQPGMSTPFYTPNSFGSPYYQNLHLAGVFPTPFGTSGYSLSGSVLPPVMASYAPQGSLATPLDSPMTPSFNGRPSGFPSASNLTGGTDFMQSYKMYGQLGGAMQPSIPDPNIMPFFQHPTLLQYAGGNQYNTMGPRVTVLGNPADNYDPLKMIPQAAYSSDQRLQLPRTGFPSLPSPRRGGTAPNYQGLPPYVGGPMNYPTSPVFQGQTLPGAFPPGKRNDSVRFQSPSRNMTASSGNHGQREKFDEQKARSFLEELKTNRVHRVELSDITGRIVEYRLVVRC
jgi:pumilio RNA-binding family